MITRRGRYALILLACSVWVVQLALTVTNEIRWPFCCHNLYYHRSELVKPMLKVRLTDDLGGEQLVDTRYLLPVDGYRTGALFREAFHESKPDANKRAYARLVLDRLNNERWRGFDERFAPAEPILGDRFVRFSLERVWVDTRSFAETGEAPIVRTETVYSYDATAEEPHA